EKAPAWHIMGTLSESCSCAVPCACNFGEAPSPHAFCWAVFATTIDKGNYGSVSLDGLKVGGANGAKGFVLYLDDSATPEQVAALKAIGKTMMMKALKANGITDPSKAPQEYRLVGVKSVHIDH